MVAEALVQGATAVTGDLEIERLREIDMLE